MKFFDSITPKRKLKLLETLIWLNQSYESNDLKRVSETLKCLYLIK